MTKIFFIHTVSGLNGMFNEICAKHVPEAEITHISDESVIKAVMAAVGLTPAIYRRVCGHVVAAEEAGADFIQLTCSSISPCADVAGHLVSKPVLKIDEPMMEWATANYKRISLVATNPATLKPSTDLLTTKAAASGRDVKVNSVLCEGAYDAFLSGNLQKHNQIVADYLRRLVDESDVVLLAQASMARVADTLEQDGNSAKIVSSPEMAVERLAKLAASSSTKT